MASSVFISHSGADATQAANVAAALQAAGIGVRLDRAELQLGDGFLAFMNDALTTSDYCLLLWSARAAATPWVAMEWEAALVRSVREKRAFLVAARLEALELPALLAPRLYVDLFPDAGPGVAQLVALWQADRAAAAAAAKPVADARQPPAADAPAAAAGGDEVYVTSEAFGIAMPWKVDLAAPAALLLAQVRQRLRLPDQVDHEGRFGLRMAYRLMHRQQPLQPRESLQAQGVAERSVLWLETAATPFGTGALDDGFETLVLRSGGRMPTALREAVRHAGAGLS